MTGRLNGKTILITGASQGIGAAAARHCAAEGATVILVARRQKRMEKVYDEITAAGSPEPYAVCFDLLTAEENEFGQLAATIAEATGGRLDGIVHSANCFTALTPLDCQTVAAWVKQYRINTVGAMGLTRAFLPMLMRRSRPSKPAVWRRGFRRRMEPLRAPARQPPHPRRGQLPPARTNPPRRVQKRTPRHRRNHARLHLLAQPRKPGAQRRNCLPVTQINAKRPSENVETCFRHK